MAAPAFHRLTLTHKHAITADAVTLSFRVPDDLRDQYRFQQGQFITLRSQIKGLEARRSYSICVAVDDYARTGELRVGVKRVAGGLVSNWVGDHLQVGDSLDVMTPDGRFFTALDANAAKNYVAFAGGSGITPVLSIIKTTLAAEPRSRFTLIYGNRNVSSIMFLEELEDLKNRYLGRLRLFHVLADEPQEVELLNGLLDQTRCATFIAEVLDADTIDEAFICGPEPMMDAAEAALLASGVARSKVHVERFGVPMPASMANPTSPKAAAGTQGMAEVRIIANGKTRVLQVPRDGVAVLDAGLNAGIDLPYACKGGVCCTCRARVTEGTVAMDKNYTLEAWEIEKGFVLTCQSHPTSDRVVINYDER